MEKSISSQEPQKFVRDPDGSSVFRWDIKQTKDEDGAIQYESSECRIFVTPTKENVEIGAVEAFCSLSEQAALLHDNNRSIMENGEPTAEYATFLNERQKIKTAVEDYFTKEDPIDIKVDPVVIKS